jgi:hypothetical protein
MLERGGLAYKEYAIIYLIGSNSDWICTCTCNAHSSSTNIYYASAQRGKAGGKRDA